ncbi:MAG: MBL fold metallo-hydrolase, partial [Puniceicoccales bacterium]
PVAIVGDALFAGSIGGVRANYHGALKMIRERVLSLPGETILCPGHGPITTVAEELQHNPYFATQS